MTLKFTQLYCYGPNWEGELINIPGSAIIYNYSKLNNCESWYIFIPKSDFNKNYKGDGCAQVCCYELGNYRILFLERVKIHNWISVKKEDFDRFFSMTFGDTYVYRYSQAMYEVDKSSPDGYKKVKDAQLLACYRLKEIYDEGMVKCSRVLLKNLITFEDELSSIEYDTLDLYDLELHRIGATKLYISNDSTLYKEKMLEVFTKIY